VYDTILFDNTVIPASGTHFKVSFGNG
jgi:hypothetical protein